MFKKIFLILHTIKYLTFKQIFYQVYYRLKKIKPLEFYYLKDSKEPSLNLRFSDFLPVTKSATNENEFTFINLTVKFDKEIDWDYNANGKLWNYNLHYCNFLLQDNITLHKRMNWLHQLYKKLLDDNTGLEPYPVSLRIINVIGLLTKKHVKDSEIFENLKAEINFLSQRLEYHIDGNHLLENGFALLCGGAFFDNEIWIEKAKNLLREELDKQILSDGAHFELSPMYHQIILHRVLELIGWYSTWAKKDSKFLCYLREIAALMCSWLKCVTFSNGDIPLVSDSAFNITYTSRQLLDFADLLQIDQQSKHELGLSGYKMYNTPHYELFIDAAEISAKIQPGHGHADALSFILYINNNPVFVDSGTSTYNTSSRRNFERSSAAHNTVVYNGIDQSEVWGGFRVAQRAQVNVLISEENRFTASHNGYKKFGISHRREIRITEEEVLIIDDLISQNLTKNDSIAYFHLHPSTIIEPHSNGFTLNKVAELTFQNALSIQTEIYNFADNFNLYTKAILIKVKLSNSLITKIRLTAI